MRYERGDKVEDIAADMGVHPRTVVRRALANGAPSRPEGRPAKPLRRWRPEVDAEIHALRAAGEKVEYIAVKLGISVRTVTRRIAARDSVKE